MGKRKRAEPLGIIQTTLRCNKRPCIKKPQKEKKTYARTKKRRKRKIGPLFSKPKQSRFIGVRWEKTKKKWKAVVRGETLGFFDADDEINAGRAVEAKNLELGLKSRNPKLLKYSYRCCGWPWEDAPPQWSDYEAVQCEWCDSWWHTKCLREFGIAEVPEHDFECPRLPNNAHPPKWEPLTHSRKCGVFYRESRWHAMVVPWFKKNGEWVCHDVEHLGSYGKEVLAARAASARRNELRRIAGVRERIITPSPKKKRTEMRFIPNLPSKHSPEPESDGLKTPRESSPEPEEVMKMLEQRLKELQSELRDTEEEIKSITDFDSLNSDHVLKSLPDEIDSYLPFDMQSKKNQKKRKKKKQKAKQKAKKNKAKPTILPQGGEEFSPPTTKQFMKMARFQEYFSFSSYYEWNWYWENCFSKNYDKSEHRIVEKEFSNQSCEDSVFENLWRRAKKKRNPELALMYLRVYKLWSQFSKAEDKFGNFPWRVRKK